VAKKPFDHKLRLKPIPVRFADGTAAQATAEGNNAGWTCGCGEHLLGRCYYQFGDTCFTECPGCKRIYRVEADDRKRAVGVFEQAA
jgi:hypothetical protein